MTRYMHPFCGRRNFPIVIIKGPHGIHFRGVGQRGPGIAVSAAGATRWRGPFWLERRHRERQEALLSDHYSRKDAASKAAEARRDA
jgi:hypothetical protein